MHSQYWVEGASWACILLSGTSLTQGYSLAERVTSLVQRLCTQIVTVVDCFAIGQWRGRQMANSVYITFGSPQQKNTFFKCWPKTSSMEGSKDPWD
jgi:hypothetical protein